jgi:hypothetical protein
VTISLKVSLVLRENYRNVCLRDVGQASHASRVTSYNLIETATTVYAMSVSALDNEVNRGKYNADKCAER